VAAAGSAAAAPREDGEMTTPAERFLTAAERDQVTAVVREVELTTSGEIVPMIVSRSDDYPMAAAVCSTAISLPLGLLLTDLLGSHLWIGDRNIWLFLGIIAFSYPVFYALILRTDGFKRFFLNRRQAEHEVREAALAAFYSERLYKTRDENGILIFISVLEQKVWILADAGINRKIEQAAWEDIVSELTAGIKAGRRCEALCAAVRRVGGILSTHFPYEKSDTDELHNLIVK
jgi:putative membrane protein